MDLGAGRRGVDMGPSAIRIGGIHSALVGMNIKVEDGGNVEVKIPEAADRGEQKQVFLNEIARVCETLADLVAETLGQEKFPLTLGGDHSLAAGSIAGTSAFFRNQNKKIGVIWVDAHADMNVPQSSPSGNVHGMPLAALMGLGPVELSEIAEFSPKVSAENVVVIGARSIDVREKLNIEKAGLRVITMKELDMRGMKAVMEEALERVCAGTEGFTAASIWMWWILRWRLESAPRFAAALLAGKVIWPWRLWQTVASCWPLIAWRSIPCWTPKMLQVCWRWN